jgi:hypothetical protein
MRVKVEQKRMRAMKWGAFMPQAAMKGKNWWSSNPAQPQA